MLFAATACQQRPVATPFRHTVLLWVIMVREVQAYLLDLHHHAAY
jgi:hypothetical protein